MKKKTFTLFSLFTGAGGMDLGFTLSKRFNVLMANDVLSDPADTYAENFHHSVVKTGEFAKGQKLPVYLLGDVAEVDFDLFAHEKADVIVGGPPCQDFSIVRGPQKERQGLAVKRGRLYGHFVRALIHIQPKAFVFENVPGLKSANKGSAYRIIQDDFAHLDVKWEEIRSMVGNSYHNEVKSYVPLFSNTINSAHLGVPQSRRRLIILGVRQDLIEPNWLEKRSRLIKTAESVLCGENSLFPKYPLTPLEVFEGKTLPDLQKEYRSIMKGYKGIAEKVGTEKAKEWQETVWKNISFDVLKDYFKINAVDPNNNGEVDKAFEEHQKVLEELGYYKSKVEGKVFSDGSNDLPNEADKVLYRQSLIPPNKNCEFVKGTEWEVEGRGMSLIYRRLHPLLPSYTVVAYGGGGTWGYHYRRDRGRLTNRERARLQSFPDSFTFKGSTAKVRAQIGEAVPPLLGKKIAEIISSILASG